MAVRLRSKYGLVIIKGLLSHAVLQKVKHFYKSVVMDGARLLACNGICFIRDIPHCDYPGFVHFLVGPVNRIQDFFYWEIPELHHLLQKRQQPGAGIHLAFHVRKFEVAMRINKTRHNSAPVHFQGNRVVMRPGVYRLYSPLIINHHHSFFNRVPYDGEYIICG